MTEELLHGAAAVRAHVQETWAPVVIDDQTLADWEKLPTEQAPEHPGEQQEPHG